MDTRFEVWAVDLVGRSCPYTPEGLKPCSTETQVWLPCSRCAGCRFRPGQPSLAPAPWYSSRSLSFESSLRAAGVGFAGLGFVIQLKRVGCSSLGLMGVNFCRRLEPFKLGRLLWSPSMVRPTPVGHIFDSIAPYELENSILG